MTADITREAVEALVELYREAGLSTAVDVLIALRDALDKAEHDNVEDQGVITVWRRRTNEAESERDDWKERKLKADEETLSAYRLKAAASERADKAERDLVEVRKDCYFAQTGKEQAERERDEALAALREIDQSRARAVIPWTHEAAADEFNRMIQTHKSIARAILAEH